MRFPFALAALVWLVAAPATAGSFDEFQVFDGRLGEPGGLGVSEYVVAGRRGQAGDGAPRNGLLATTEFSHATTAWHEVSLYLPAALDFSGALFGGGFKLRNSFVVPGAAERPVAWGFDLELRHQSYRFADADWGVTLRPIFDLRQGPWQLILNPAIEVPIGRGSAVFAPAVRGVRKVAEQVWIGLEHYMDFGRFDRQEPIYRQAHQAFFTTDIRVSDSVALHFGVGHGLTHASDRWLGKLILTLDF